MSSSNIAHAHKLTGVSRGRAGGMQGCLQCEGATATGGDRELTWDLPGPGDPTSAATRRGETRLVCEQGEKLKETTSKILGGGIFNNIVCLPSYFIILDISNIYSTSC